MATMNPLEKKARSSFIKGIVLAGVIGIAGMALLGMKIYKMNGEEKARIAAQRQVVILNRDVKSGEEITIADLQTVSANGEVVNAMPFTMADFDSMTTVIDEANNVYNFKIISKIDLPQNTILTQDMLIQEEYKITDDLREQEFNMLVLPTGLADGDIVDVRFRLPSGENFIVIPKKKVSLVDLNGTYSSQTIKMDVTEEQTLLISSAIVDAYQLEGSLLYVTKYTDPGLQAAAIPTYAPSYETLRLISEDPNIVSEARDGLVSRYSDNYQKNRGSVANALTNVEQSQRDSAIQSKTQTEISTQQTERSTYLESMYGLE